MKNIIVLLAIVSVVSFGDEKNKVSCCMKTAAEEFAEFGKNIAFVSLHEAPEPFTYQSVRGEMKSIKTADNINANIYEVRSTTPTQNYIFVFHEWWGLNDYIKQESEKFQIALGNVNIIAIDLYDGKIAEVPDSARKYVSTVDEQRVRTIIQAAIDYVGKKAKIATLGWCFGGSWSLQSALMLGKQAAGCVLYYGMPEKDVKKLKTLQCDVLGIFGTQDGFINPTVVAEFEKNMKAAKKNLTVKNYDAVHAFANPSNPNHDKEKSVDANLTAIAFLKSKLKL